MMEYTVAGIVMMVLQGTVFVLACLGNALVVTVIVKYLPRRSVTNRFIVNLAVADMLTGLAALSQIVYTLVPKLNENVTTCLLRYQVLILLTLTSQLTVTFTTFDRYIAICKPHRYGTIMTSRFANILIVTSWVYAIILTIVPFVGFNNWNNFGCIYQILVKPWQHLLMALTLWVFSTVTATMYGMILKTAFGLYRQNQPLSKVANTSKSEDVESNNAQNEGGKSNCKKRTRIMNKVQGAKALAAVTLVFAICWLPYTYFQIRGVVDNGYLFSEEWEAARWVVFLGMANSIMNPFIYAWQRRDFRAACHRLVSCRSPVGVHEAELSSTHV